MLFDERITICVTTMYYAPVPSYKKNLFSLSFFHNHQFYMYFFFIIMYSHIALFVLLDYSVILNL